MSVFAETLFFSQFAHVYSVTEIRHIDDNDLGSIYTKVTTRDFKKYTNIAVEVLKHCAV